MFRSSSGPIDIEDHVCIIRTTIRVRYFGVTDFARFLRRESDARMFSDAHYGNASLYAAKGCDYNRYIPR